MTNGGKNKHLHIARTVSVSTACTTRCRSTPFQRNVERSAADPDLASLGSQACGDRERGGGGGRRERGLKGSAYFALQILVIIKQEYLTSNSLLFQH